MERKLQFRWKGRAQCPPIVQEQVSMVNYSSIASQLLALVNLTLRNLTLSLTMKRTIKSLIVALNKFNFPSFHLRSLYMMAHVRPVQRLTHIIKVSKETMQTTGTRTRMLTGHQRHNEDHRSSRVDIHLAINTIQDQLVLDHRNAL